MSALKKLWLWALVAMVCAPMVACNTIEGAGEDIEATGEAIDRGAEAAQD